MGSPNTLTVQLNHLYVELTMSTINRGVRTASRTLRTPALQSRAPLRTPLAFTSRANFTASPRTTPSSHRQFSVMAARQSGAPPPPQAREYDPEIKDIASYVHNTPIDSDLAFDTARFAFLDTLGCGLEGLRFKECTKLLGPIVEGTVVPNGTKVPGTPFGQLGCYFGSCRLDFSHKPSWRKLGQSKGYNYQRGLGGHDQGTRDSRLPGSSQLLQQGRFGPCCTCQGCLCSCRL